MVTEIFVSLHSLNFPTFFLSRMTTLSTSICNADETLEALNRVPRIVELFTFQSLQYNVNLRNSSNGLLSELKANSKILSTNEWSVLDF